MQQNRNVILLQVIVAKSQFSIELSYFRNYFFLELMFFFRQEFLQSLIEIVEKYGKYPEDPLMRLLLPLLLKYIKVYKFFISPTFLSTALTQ